MLFRRGSDYSGIKKIDYDLLLRMIKTNFTKSKLLQFDHSLILFYFRCEIKCRLMDLSSDHQIISLLCFAQINK